MGEGASVNGYSNERGKGILHSVEPSCINGVVTVSMTFNVYASQHQLLRSPGFFFHC